MFLSNAVKFGNTNKLGGLGALNLAVSVLLMFCLFSVNAYAIDQTPWTSQFGSAVDDYAGDIAMDAAGNTYVTGYTMGDLGGASAGSADVYIAKIDPTGNVLWVAKEATADFERGTSIAIDAANNVYVTGYTIGLTATYFIVKYDTDGNRLWGNQYSGEGGHYGFGIDVAPTGDIYVCGQQYQFVANAAVTYFASITKFDSNGVLLWNDTFGATSATFNQPSESCSDVAVGDDGFIYMTGSTGECLTASCPGTGDVFVAKYNSAGSRQWLMELGTAGADRAGKIAVDAAGNSYVSGNTSDTAGDPLVDGRDIITAKVNTNGALQWIDQLGSATYDLGSGVAVDGNGVVYSAGVYNGASNFRGDMVLIKYDTDGNRLSLDTMSSGGGDTATAIAVESAGTNYFIAGSTSGNLDGQTNAGVGSDVFVTHNNPTAVPGAVLVNVPNVVGLSQAAATAEIEAAGLVVAIVEAFDDVVPAGNVVSQDPVAGDSAAEGSTVTLTISLGPQPVTVATPDVVGSSEAVAVAAIEAAGLVAAVNLANDPVVPEGDVISQTPVGGTIVDTGSTVTITVSIGPEPQLTVVPDVRNTPLADAEASISALLVVGTITEEYSPAFPVIPAGNVISTNPSGGALVNVGSTVDIVVSLGPAPIATPDVLGLPQADAEAAIVAAGLVVGTVTLFSSDTVAAGNVISQSPLVGYPVTPGTAVDLTVSSGPAGPVIVTVPSVVGSTQADAEAAIVAAGLTVGAVTTASSATVAAGDVISQTPAGGTDVEEGSSVDLVVSTGSALVTVPNVVGDSYATAVAAIENAGLVVGNVSTVTTRRSCGRVNSQSPAGGTNVPAGTAVDLVGTRTRFCNPL